jgi:hypothetical protein
MLRRKKKSLIYMNGIEDRTRIMTQTILYGSRVNLSKYNNPM